MQYILFMDKSKTKYLLYNINVELIVKKKTKKQQKADKLLSFTWLSVYTSRHPFMTFLSSSSKISPTASSASSWSNIFVHWVRVEWPGIISSPFCSCAAGEITCTDDLRLCLSVWTLVAERGIFAQRLVWNINCKKSDHGKLKKTGIITNLNSI